MYSRKSILEVQDIIVYILIGVVYGGALLVYFQFSLIGRVVLTPAAAKIGCGLLMFVWVVFFLIAPLFSRNDVKVLPYTIDGGGRAVLFFYIAVLLSGFFSIVLLSGDQVGIGNAVGAFLYNYSLFIFVLPFSVIYFICIKVNDGPTVRGRCLLWKVFGIFVVLSSVVQVVQVISGGPVVMWVADEMRNMVYSSQMIKFDQLGGIYRAQGFFRSPLEAGIVGVFSALVVLDEAVYGKNNGFWYIILVIIGAGVLATGSRTVFVMLGFSLSCYVLLSFQQVQYIRSRLYKFGLFALPLLLSLCVYNVVSTDIRFVGSMADPTNLMIRLSNWGDLISRLLDSCLYFFFGMGIVQNGNYGIYHSVIIDNTLIGVLMTSGIIGALLFFCVVLSWVSYSLKAIKQVGLSADVLICFNAGFFAASFTENMMHFSFYPVMFSVLYLIFSKSTYSSVHNFGRLKIQGKRMKNDWKINRATYE